jgi:hypothetical protein
MGFILARWFRGALVLGYQFVNYIAEFPLFKPVKSQIIVS